MHVHAFAMSKQHMMCNVLNNSGRRRSVQLGTVRTYDISMGPAQG